MKKGFTLIELLVVVAIIGVLSSIVLSALSQVKEQAQNTRTVSALQQMKRAAFMYELDHGYWPGDAFTTGCECHNTSSYPGFISDEYFPESGLSDLRLNGSMVCIDYQNWEYTTHPALPHIIAIDVQLFDSDCNMQGGSLRVCLYTPAGEVCEDTLSAAL